MTSRRRAWTRSPRTPSTTSSWTSGGSSASRPWRSPTTCRARTRFRTGLPCCTRGRSRKWAPWKRSGTLHTMVSVLSERRLNRLLNPALSVGLPAFLTRGAGMFSGMMLSQYTADSLIVEQRMLSAPASVGSIPAAADQEDFVSMGMNTAIKNGQILDDAYGVLGIEFMAAAQALDFRDFAPGRGVTAAKAVVRKYVAHLDEDRPLYPDHNRMKE